MKIGDVVRVERFGVGVIGDFLGGPQGEGRFIVFTRNRQIDIAPSQIAEVLPAPTFTVGQPVTFGIISGTITAIHQDTATTEVSATRRRPGLILNNKFRPPLWMLTRENDMRIS